MRLTGTRQTIHDALAWGLMQKGESGMMQYLTYLTRIEKSIKAGEPCGDFLEAAYICAAINAQPPHIAGWIKFAYGPECSDLVLLSIAVKLRDQLGPKTPRQNQRFLALAESSVEGYRLRIWRSKDLPVELYSERMGTDPSHFSRDWEPKRTALQRTIKQWDAEGVGYVSTMIRALNGASDYRPTEVLQDMVKNI